MANKNVQLKYYRLDKILKHKATYNLIYGERSNGKTYAVLERIVKKYCAGKGQGIVVRRMKEDLDGVGVKNLFDNLIHNGVITLETKGKWDLVEHRGGAFYFAKYDKKIDRMILDSEPFAFAIYLSGAEHKKSIAYPNVTLIFFDEFITRSRYLEDEFVLFMNLISTIVRHRDNVEIFMCANTVNKYCIYFKEMGLDRVKNQQKDTIDVYHYGTSGLKVAVEYTHSLTREGKPSDKYFAFDNPKLDMITNGAWEMAMYPHITRDMKYKPKDVKYTFFIIWEEDILQCEIVFLGKNRFIAIHRKTTELKNPDKDLVYCPDISHHKNWSRRITIARNKLENEIVKLFKEEKVFYQDNEVGEIVRNYVLWCKTQKLLN